MLNNEIKKILAEKKKYLVNRVTQQRSHETTKTI